MAKAPIIFEIEIEFLPDFNAARVINGRKAFRDFVSLTRRKSVLLQKRAKTIAIFQSQGFRFRQFRVIDEIYIIARQIDAGLCPSGIIQIKARAEAAQTPKNRNLRS